MIKVKQLIIVEGKYDKIALENVIDGLIIPTDGFAIFKNKEKCEMIRRLSRENGLIIMTDSDSAGSVIRGYIKKIVGDAEIINIYVPRLEGKEKRKTKAGKEGILGVEGMSREIISEALLRSGVKSHAAVKNGRKITKTDMFEAGLSGCAGSSDRRKKLLKYLSLPQGLSPNAMLDVINNILSFEEFSEITESKIYERQES